jgi:hypothetical protein
VFNVRYWGLGFSEGLSFCSSLFVEMSVERLLITASIKPKFLASSAENHVSRSITFSNQSISQRHDTKRGKEKERRGNQTQEIDPIFEPMNSIGLPV